MPAISVLMPVYNAGQFLKEAVDSILNQTFTDFEFLIFNDGSTDDSKKILSAYTDPRIRLMNFDINQGYVPLLNLGLEIARGEYIARMDADDVSAVTRFQKQYEFLQQHPDYILCGSRYTIIGTGRKFNLPIDDHEIKLRMLCSNPLCHPSILVRKEILSRNNIRYDERHMPSEDFEMWTQLSDFGKFYNFSESLLFYRLHNNNISFRKQTQEQEGFFRLTRKKYISKFFRNTGLTDFGEATLYELFSGNYSDYKDLLKFRDLLQKIIKANYRYAVRSDEVHSFLEQCYFNQCTASTRLGIKAFLLGNEFGFYKIPWMLNLKLLIKSVIRYQPISFRS